MGTASSWSLVRFELVGIFIVCPATRSSCSLAIIGLVVCAAGLVVGRLLQMAAVPASHKPVPRTQD